MTPPMRGHRGYKKPMVVKQKSLSSRPKAYRMVLKPGATRGTHGSMLKVRQAQKAY